MLDHLNLLRHLEVVFGTMLAIWFIVMFVHFWILDRKRHRR